MTSITAFGLGIVLGHRDPSDLDSCGRPLVLGCPPSVHTRTHAFPQVSFIYIYIYIYLSLSLFLSRHAALPRRKTNYLRPPPKDSFQSGGGSAARLSSAVFGSLSDAALRQAGSAKKRVSLDFFLYFVFCHLRFSLVGCFDFFCLCHFPREN